MRDPRSAGLTELELLVSVAETGSLGRTASGHGVSQPAVSMRMTALERRLGLKLLVRGPSGTRLTPEGEQVVQEARRLLDADRSLAALTARLRRGNLATLRVAASFTIAEHLLPGWTSAMEATGPEVQLALEVVNSAHVLSSVAAKLVDIGFVEGIARELPGIAAETVASDELVVVVSPSHPWALRQVPVEGPELAATELVVREPGSGTREVLDEALRPWGGPSARLELGSSGALLAAARRGEGPAVLSSLVAGDDLATGRLVAVPVGEVAMTRRLRAIWPGDAGLGPLARRLLAAARSEAGPGAPSTPARVG